MSRETMPMRYSTVTLPALRLALQIFTRLATIAVLGVLGSAMILYLVRAAPADSGYGLLSLALVPVGMWLGCLCRSLVWLLVGQGVGLRLAWVFVGSGPFVTTLVRPRRVIVLRLLPLSLRPALLATDRPALKLQYWLTAVWAVLAMVVTGVLLWTRMPAPWGQAAAMGTTLSIVVSLWPYRHGGVTDLWILFRLPFLDERATRAFVTEEDVLELAVAEEACDLERAKAALGRLEARGAEPGQLCHWRSAVLEMEGRYAEALREQRRELELGVSDHARPWQLMNLADLLLAAGDAGQLPVFEWQPAAEAAIAEITPALPHALAASTRAYYHVLTGDYRKGARLARVGVRAATSRIEAAQSLCTLAVARAGTWDSEGAAEALRKARALAPGWPRVEQAEDRVQRLMPVPV
jgi:hypothetical protein